MRWICTSEVSLQAAIVAEWLERYLPARTLEGHGFEYCQVLDFFLILSLIVSLYIGGTSLLLMWDSP